MSLDQTPPPQPSARDDKLLPVVGWVTYICGFAPVGLVIAYLDRGNARQQTRDNYGYMIRTFWIGCLYLTIAVIGLIISVIGAIPRRGDDTVDTSKLDASLVGVQTTWMVVFLILSLWFYVRCIKGVVTLVRDKPIRNPSTWLV